MATVKIREWRKHQHYKDRNPPWVKLHHSLFLSKDWRFGSMRTRILLIVSILMASRGPGDGTFEIDSLDDVRAFGSIKGKVDFGPLIKSKFLEIVSDASGLLADAIPETETETEAEAKQRHRRRPSKKKQNGQPKKSKAAIARWEAFYERYPRKIGKPHAETAFLARTIKDQKAALEGLEVWVTYWRLDGTPMKFIPHPTTWLNQRRWEDGALDEVSLKKGEEYYGTDEEVAEFNRQQAERHERFLEAQEKGGDDG